MRKILPFIWLLPLILAACGQFGLEGQVLVPTLVPAADTPTSASEPTRIPTPVAEPTLTPEPAQAQMLAYVQDGALYIRPADSSRDPVQVESCSPGTHCMLLHPQWSPDGTQLLYLRSEFGGTPAGVLKVAGLDGATRILSGEASNVFAPAWSPDGRQIAYVVNTQDFAAGEQQLALHVAQADLSADEVAGTLGFLVGCGGGPGSVSQQVLQMEGFGYFSTRLAWAAGDILLYSRGCDGSGIGRFDLKSRQRLDPYPDTRQLLNFTLNADRTRWAAVSMFDGGEKTEIALGNPAQLNYETFAAADSNRVHSVFFGPRSGKLYYTTRQQTFSENLAMPDYAGDSFPIISGYFEFNSLSLWAMTPGAGAESLGVFDLFGLGSLTEDAGGAVLFTQVPNDKLLYDAMQAGKPAEESIAAQPYASIMRLLPGGALESVVDHAGQLALTRP